MEQHYYRVRLKTPPLQKSHYFQNNIIFLVNFSEVIRETFAISAANFSISMYCIDRKQILHSDKNHQVPFVSSG